MSAANKRLGEFELIERLERWLDGPGGSVVVGTGDDGAVIDSGGDHVVVAVDTMVEGRHFDRSLSTFEDVGWKAVAVNVSDLAAMAARPMAALVALCRPDNVTVAQLEETYIGMRAAADRWGLALVGGDTVSADTLTITITALGTVAPGAAMTRSGARPKDAVVVIGGLGGAAAGLALHRAGKGVLEGLARAHRRPLALPDAGAALARSGARAMIDVSDGFGADLGHLCRQSGVGAEIDVERLPVMAGVVEAAGELEKDPWAFALGGGDDYALIAAVPPDRARQAVDAVERMAGVPAAIVGTFTDGWVDGELRHEPRAVLHGAWQWIADRGFDHYVLRDN